jgi:hypothetical protein
MTNVITFGDFTFKPLANDRDGYYEVYHGDIRYISNVLTLEVCPGDIKDNPDYLAHMVKCYSGPRLMIIDESYYIVDSRKILEYCDEMINRNIDRIYDSLSWSEPKEPDLKPEQTNSYDLRIRINQEWDKYRKKKAECEHDLKIKTLLGSKDNYRSLELVKKLGLKVRVTNFESDYDGYLKRYEGYVC